MSWLPAAFFNAAFLLLMGAVTGTAGWMPWHPASALRNYHFKPLRPDVVRERAR
jgi:hypothetical protein